MNIYLRKKHPSYYQDLPHTMEDRTPYTYLIGWSKLDMWYYGRRTHKYCHPTELFNLSLMKSKRYCTSSVEVEKFISLHGLPDIIQIRQIYASTKRCKRVESTALRILDVAHNNKFLNKKNGDENWDTTGISFSEEINKSKGAHAKGKRRIKINGVYKFVDSIPEDTNFEKIAAPNKGRKEYNNGERTIYLNVNDNIPVGFMKGKLNRWFNDGINNYQIPNARGIAQNLIPGRLTTFGKYVR